MAEPQISQYEFVKRQQQDALKYQLDFSDVLEHIRKYLEGMYYDEQAGAYVGYQTDNEGNPIPLMNPRGVSLVMRTLVGFLHKGIVLGNISHEEATEWAQMIHKSIAKTLFIHGTEIDMAPSDIREITLTISTNVYSALTRAISGSTATQLNQIVTVHEEKSQSDGKRGVF